MKISHPAGLFLAGGGSYVLLELIWRGRSHITMFFAGGLCMVLIAMMEEAEPRLPPITRTIAEAGIITMVELAFGILFNRDYRIWDYRAIPGNFCGQICPAFSLLWIPVAIAAAGSYRLFFRKH